MKGTGRWLSGKSGLVHQLASRNVTAAPPPRYCQGAVSSYYEVAAPEVIAVLWEPVCGARRKKNLRVGKHEGPVTCLACIGGGYED